MDKIETIEISPNEFVEIYVDSDPESPRDWDNLGQMICWHRRYNLGDRHDYKDPSDFEPDPQGVCLPLYLYDHSGITISTKPFSCPWDSGKVGYIYCSPEQIKCEFGDPNRETKAKVEQCLINEVEVYDQYLRGEVYGYQHFKQQDCESYYDFNNEKCWTTEPVDSCWGFYGPDWKKNGIAEHIPSLRLEKV
jgi:hypothetical protein